MIRPGQIYESCQPVRSESVDRPGVRHVRLKVLGEPGRMHGLWGYGKVTVVTLTEDGREVRRRSLEASQLHASGTTKDGAPRRTGYRLVQDAPEVPDAG